MDYLSLVIRVIDPCIAALFRSAFGRHSSFKLLFETLCIDSLLMVWKYCSVFLQVAVLAIAIASCLGWPFAAAVGYVTQILAKLIMYMYFEVEKR